jgi:CRISPR/Cas system CSM-associated protein Csm3 (group 7 of RAMP superfamily)
MIELRLDWTWQLVGPLHCGSGMSRAGRADRLVQRDVEGKPVIVGDAVKGALRMSAEQLAAWLTGAPQRYQEDDSSPWLAEPVSRPLALVFGGEAIAHFQPARPIGHAVQDVFTSTAIKGQTGTAEDQTLRTIEFVAPGARFASSVSVSVDPADLDVISTLLVSALAATEHLGAKAGIGWGAVKLETTELRVSHSPVHSESVVDGPRLEQLRAALGQRYRTSTAKVTVENRTRAEPRWHRLDIELCEPVTLGRDADVANAVATEHAIRSTTLRGACGRAWHRAGADEVDIQAWLNEDTRWSPGFPASADSALIPVPASWMYPKKHRDTSLRDRPLVDALAVATLPLIDNERAQWLSLGGGWVAWRDGRPVQHEVPLVTQMHVARNYDTGSKVMGALYSRESVAPRAMRFVAFAYVPEDAWRDHSTPELLLGRRKSAGNGLASLTVTAIDTPSLDLFGGSRSTDSIDADVYIQLLTPAFVRDRRTGEPLRTLDVDWWAEHFELAPEAIIPDSPDASSSACRTRHGRRGGWMVPWRHPRAPITVIEQGSVWRLRCRDVATAQSIRERCPRGLHGIGDRQYEGFGWAAFDPAWLGVSLDARTRAQVMDRKSAEAEGRPQAPKSWPGVELLAREVQLQLLQNLPAKLDPTTTGALHELARQAREAHTTADVAEIQRFYQGRVDRHRADAWAELEKQVALPGQCWEDADRLRFRLEALLVRATPFK